MNAAAYAAMSDPARNVQFRRGWTEAKGPLNSEPPKPKTFDQVVTEIAMTWRRGQGVRPCPGLI